jgi:hypothetical protein
VDAVEVKPFIRQGGILVARKNQREQSSECVIGGYSYTACENGR